MAGRRSKQQSPGRTALSQAVDRARSLATALDQASPGAGEAFRKEVARLVRDAVDRRAGNGSSRA